MRALTNSLVALVIVIAVPIVCLGQTGVPRYCKTDAGVLGPYPNDGSVKVGDPCFGTDASGQRHDGTAVMSKNQSNTDDSENAIFVCESVACASGGVTLARWFNLEKCRSNLAGICLELLQKMRRPGMGIGPAASPPQQNGSFDQLLPLIKTVIKLGCSHHIDAEESDAVSA